MKDRFEYYKEYAYLAANKHNLSEKKTQSLLEHLRHYLDVHPNAYRETVLEYIHQRCVGEKPVRVDMSCADGVAIECPAIEDMGLREALDKALSKLTAREEFVVVARFGLGVHEPMTLTAVGDVLGLQGETVRRIEIKALHKLRHPSRSCGLREYL